MTCNIPDGLYVVAVSGGVDSMVLLDVLAMDPRRAAGRLQLIVAHYDHGIRPDSGLDRKLVAQAAKRYGLRFVYDEGHLGAGASEATARKARYGFLNTLRQAAGADAIVTAHHQDDVLETALINLMRGTHRRGLSSLVSTADVVRPLLSVPKQELYAYASENGITWREDSTNADTRYLRNRIRHDIVPRMSAAQRQNLLALLERSQQTNVAVDDLLEHVLDNLFDAEGLDRAAFKKLPASVALEVVAAWLRRNNIRDYDAPTLQRITEGICTLATGKRIDVMRGANLEIGRTRVRLNTDALALS